MTFVQLLILMGVLIGIIALYIGTMYLNDHTEIPEECREAYLEAQSCETCALSSGDKKSCGFGDTLEFIKEVTL